ncbi:MAG: bifunctional DNA-formamidopyrimidine glycosylase/DNA-(apurinic or apyrimidinic site) lyase [Planctomycetes bacterium]|nr:bifunctional DNA-formamidopyrimidine glycosylase/DNA-(apurinic or apyrimidinic site) lyase [Planctomycetota bacterium]
MPELPEVETVVRDLRPLLVGRVLLDVSNGAKRLRYPWKPTWNRRIRGLSVEAIGRRAKFIIVGLTQDASLLIHLGMTGQLTCVPDDEIVADHLHLRFRLSGGFELRYRDIRRFGGVEFHTGQASLEKRFESVALGPEPWLMDGDNWVASLMASSRAIKSLLIDQSTISGLGNIYADEALHRAGIHPARQAKSLTRPESTALLQAAGCVMEEAIAGRGTTLRDYVGGSGLGGTHQHSLAVYGREGEPCSRCGLIIIRIMIAGRSSHFCPGCQSQDIGKRGGNRVLP